MESKFQLPRGILVPTLSGIEEGYSVQVAPKGYYVFTANVSSERIYEVFCRLAQEVREPGFLVLEAGTDRDTELQMRKSENDPFHNDVYYMDVLKWMEAKAIFDSYTEVLTQDGQICFGFGSRKGPDEVLVGYYKIFSIFTDDPGKYENALNAMGFGKVDQLKTYWECFSPNSPGERFVLPENPRGVRDMIFELEEKGLYLYQRREG